MSKFNQFTTLDKELVDALASIGFVELSPIQEKTIPLLLKHKEGVFKAPTGSGKTLAYLVPIIQSIKGLNDTKAVVIVPTKVLANQAGEVLKNIRQVYPNFTYSVIKDGNDLVKSNKTSSIIIATPNLFLKSMHEMNLREVEYLIFDEGDMLIFGGFEEQLNQIMSLPLKATKALFTASVDEQIILDALYTLFDFTPAGIIERFSLTKPTFKYQELTNYGHFGRPDLDLPFEKLDMVDKLIEFCHRG